MEPVTAFVFQSNPDIWDLRRFFEPGAHATWSVNQYGEQMGPGQLVLFWEAKGSQKTEVRGLYGWGITTSEVIGGFDNVASQVIKGSDDGTKIQVHYIERWVHPKDVTRDPGEHIAPVPASEVLSLPSWKEHRLASRVPQGTNFIVISDQLEELVEKIIKTRFPDSQLPEAVNMALKHTPLDVGQFTPRTIPELMGGGGFVKVRAIEDTPAESDRLGFTPLVEGLDRLLNDKDTRLPLAIAITAPWGGGKSSVMRQLQKRLREDAEHDTSTTRKKWHIVDFPAWKYERSEQLWAALAKTIYEQSQEDMGKDEPLLFRLIRPQWFKLRVEWYRLGKWPFLLRSLIAPIIIFGALLALILGIANLLTEEVVGAVQWGGGSLVAAIFAALWGKFGGVLSHPFKRAIDRYSANTRYEEQLGFTTEAAKDVDNLIKTLTPNENDAIAVFVDDLDRCSPRNTVDMVEAINQIFNTIRGRRCVFVLGMEREVVAASIDVTYKDTVQYLRDKDSPLGYNYGQRFLAKIVQLSVAIPKPEPDAMMRLLHDISPHRDTPNVELEAPNEDDVNRYLELLEQPGLSNPVQIRKARSEIESSQTDLDAQKILALDMAERTARAKLFGSESEDFLLAEEEGMKCLDRNPRQLKRFDNAFRLQLYVANSSTGTSLEFNRDEMRALAKWTAVRVRWPGLAEALDREGRELLEALVINSNNPKATIDNNLKERYEEWFKNKELRVVLKDTPSRRITTLPFDTFLEIA